MGTALIKFYQEKIKREWKFAFFAACAVGFLIHTYKFTNTLLNHDALFNQYSSQNMVGSGRWLLSLACGISSFFDLPWVNGVLSILYIAFTAVIIADIFRVEDPVLAGTIGALLVSFPAMTETFMFEFTADGYMLAMLLAALSVRLALFEETRWWRYALSALCICCSCGIYQVYMAFAMVLALAYFITEMLEGRHTNKECGLFIARELILYAVALTAYYGIWRVCLRITHGTASGYIGLDTLGQRDPLSSAVHILRAVSKFVLGGNVFRNGASAWTVFGLGLVLVGGAVLGRSAVLSRVWKRKLQAILGGVALLLIPFAAYVWNFLSANIQTNVRTAQSLCICVILVAVLSGRYLSVRYRTAVGCFLAVLILYSGLLANVYYRQMTVCNQKSYATATEMAVRMHELDDGSVTAILIYGSDDWSRAERQDPAVLGHMGALRLLDKNLAMVSPQHTYAYLKEVTGFELSYYRTHPDAQMPVIEGQPDWPVPQGWRLAFPVATADGAAAIYQSQAFLDMPIWPAKGSVAVINDTIVVKLSRVETEAPEADALPE